MTFPLVSVTVALLHLQAVSNLVEAGTQPGAPLSAFMQGRHGNAAQQRHPRLGQPDAFQSVKLWLCMKKNIQD